MSIVTDGLRSDKWRPFAKQKLAQLKTMGLLTKKVVVDGYKISLLTMDDIEKARITAPPGAVVVDQTGGVYNYRYSDQYGGDLQLTDSRSPADGVTARALFSSGFGDITYHGWSDTSIPQSNGVSFIGAWYAPRAKFGGDPIGVNNAGYITIPYSASVPPAESVAFGLTRAGFVYMATSTRFNPANVVIGALRAVTGAIFVLVQNTTVSSSPSFHGIPDFRARAYFIRPVWGENAAMIYVVSKGECSNSLGIMQVRLYRLDVGVPFTGVSITYLGHIRSDMIADGIGLAVPCGDSTADTAAFDAWAQTLFGDWPIYAAPYTRGSFSLGLHDVCFWGPSRPSMEIKGLVFSPYAPVVKLLNIVLPPHDSTTFQPVVTEISLGYYVCELLNPATYEFQAIYYGSPLTGWTKFDHPPGVILRHRTIRATATEIKAIALVFADGVTTLYEYDSATGTAWKPRGKAAGGNISRADVALFGAHKFAHLAGQDSPVRALWR